MSSWLHFGRKSSADPAVSLLPLKLEAGPTEQKLVSCVPSLSNQVQQHAELRQRKQHRCPGGNNSDESGSSGVARTYLGGHSPGTPMPMAFGPGDLMAMLETDALGMQTVVVRRVGGWQ